MGDSQEPWADPGNTIPKIIVSVLTCWQLKSLRLRVLIPNDPMTENDTRKKESTNLLVYVHLHLCVAHLFENQKQHNLAGHLANGGLL